MRCIYGLFICMLISVAATAQCVINASANFFPANVCSGDTVTLSATSSETGVTFSWTGPKAYMASGQNALVPAIDTGKTGWYKVVVSKSGCTSDSDSVLITVKQRPAWTSIKSNAPLCVNDSLIIAVSHNKSFSWKTIVSGPAGFKDSFYSGQNRDTVGISQVTKANAGTYVLIAEDTSTGCFSDTQTINIPQYLIVNKPGKPTATAAEDTLCKGDTLQLNATSPTPVTNYHWTGPNQQSYTVQNITINGYHVTGLQEFIVQTDSNGCFSEPDTVLVDVRPVDAPKVTISADPGFITGTFVQVTFTANGTDTGYNTQYQWYKNGALLPGETGKTYTAVTTQTIQHGDMISVWMQTKPTCAATDTAHSPVAVLYVKLGIDDVPGTSSLKLYPNPVKDILTLEGVHTNLYITDVTGKRMNVPVNVHTSAGTTVADCSMLPQGLYILHADSRSAKFFKLK